jgi:quercetin dioxygenase-like cupin family protein
MEWSELSFSMPVNIRMEGIMADKKPIDPKLLAEPFNYASLVSYQEGSVVSRTIIKKDAGTVTAFAFDEGERLSTHSAPFDALLQVVEGEGIITIEDKEFEIKAPYTIVLPADKPHAVDARNRFKMVLTMIRSK